MISRAKPNRAAAWLSYGAGAVSFLGLSIYILSLRPGRDSRWICALFMLTYPVVTLPIMLTLVRVRNQRYGQDFANSDFARLITRSLGWAFLVGILPAVWLAVGRFAPVIPNQPAEFPLFLSLVATASIYLALAGRWSKQLSAMDRRRAPVGADKYPSERKPQRRRKKRTVLRWLLFAAAAVALCVCLLPYSPVYFGRGIVSVVVVTFYLSLLSCGLLALIVAVRHRQAFVVEMATSVISLYSATAVIGYYFSKLILSARYPA